MKKMFAAACVLLFIVSTASLSFGATMRCTVDAVDGDTVTMTCDKADQVKEGDKLRIRPPKKGAAIEGC